MGKVVNQFVMTVVGFALIVLAISLVKCTYSLFDDTPPKPWAKSETGSKPRVQSEASSKASAVTACRKIVRRSAVYGSKADFNGWSRRYGHIGGALAVQEEVELMNGLGLMVPHTYRCQYENGQAQLIWLRPGSE
jgi:hypothetical protein